jgi:putative membrane protein (TIGR04086 family)
VGFEKLSAVFLAAVEGTARLSYLQMLAGFTSALIAGYAAARMAGRNELLNGCLAALPCSALTAYRMATNDNVLTSTADILMIAAAFAFALVGGFLAKLHKQA